MKIAHYKTLQGAKKYASYLQSTTPELVFEPCQHPTEFGFSVKLADPAYPTEKTIYCLSRGS